MPLFGGGGKRAEKKSRVLELLRAFFEKYAGIDAQGVAVDVEGGAVDRLGGAVAAHKPMRYQLPEDDHLAIAAEDVRK